MPLDQHYALKDSFPFERLTDILRWTLIVFGAMHALMIGVRLWLHTIMGSVHVSEWTSTHDTVDRIQGSGSVVLIVMLLITIVLFFIWLQRAKRNTAILEAEGVGYGTDTAAPLRLTALIMPYRLAKDVWTASNPETYVPGKPTAWTNDEEWKPVTLWWAFWIVAIVLEVFTHRIFTDVESINQFQQMLIMFVVDDILYIIAIILAIRFIRGVYQRQQARYALIHEQGDGLRQSDQSSFFLDSLNSQKTIIAIKRKKHETSPVTQACPCTFRRQGRCRKRWCDCKKERVVSNYRRSPYRRPCEGTLQGDL